MSAKTNTWLATASALVLLSGPALAQNTTADPNVTIVTPDGAAEQAGEAVDNAAGATVDATEDAAQATGAAAQNAAQSTGAAVEGAAEGTTTTVETAPAQGEVETEAAAEGEMTTDTEEVADGTPVEGQIFEQSPDTFLASTLMDGSVINTAGEEIGGVSDLVMTSDGNVTGVVIGVGGWLGIGQKNVAIEMGRIEITQAEGGEFAFQLDATREELEAAPEFQTQEDIEAEQAATAAGTGAGGAGGAGGTMGGGTSTTTSTPPATAAQ